MENNGNGSYSEKSGKGDRGRHRDGDRRPLREKGGNKGQGDWPGAAPPAGNETDGASAFVAVEKTEDQEDDEAWGDWGGASDEELEDDAPSGTPCKELPLPSFSPHG